jgi:hypothetical protein
MNININKSIKLLFFITSILLFKNCIAQKNKNQPYIISYGANLVFEDKTQFVNYINNEEVLWNISPITFGIEKRLNNMIGIVGYIGSNLYPEKQKIGGISSKVPKDVFYFDIISKLNLLSLLQYKSTFDPFITLGTGYYYRGEANEINLNLGAGFNYWMNDIYGINLNLVYKINEPLLAEKTPSDLLQISLMLVQTIK